MEQKIKDLKNNIISYIHTNKISMKPRWHFVLYLLLRLTAVFMVFVSVIYLASFVALVMRENALFRVFGVRPQTVHEFMLGIPWLIVLLSIALLIILEILTRKFEFVYKRPIVYSLFGLLVLVLAAGAVVYRIDKEFRFARFGERPEAPILGPVHRYYRGEFNERPFIKGMHRRLPTRDIREMKYSP